MCLIYSHRGSSLICSDTNQSHKSPSLGKSRLNFVCCLCYWKYYNPPYGGAILWGERVSIRDAAAQRTRPSRSIDRRLEAWYNRIESRNTYVKSSGRKKELSATRKHQRLLSTPASLCTPQEKIKSQPPYSAVSSSSCVCGGGESIATADVSETNCRGDHAYSFGHHHSYRFRDPLRVLLSPHDHCLILAIVA